MRTAPVVDVVTSGSWEAASPAVSLVVATHDRCGFLQELVAALEQLEEPAGGFEVVLVDDGSSDVTWSVLRGLLAASPLAVCALRIEATGGPSVPRNTGVTRSRGGTIAFTDDDCLPDPGWLRALSRSVGTGVAQGATRPGPTPPAGPWDRSITVSRLTGLHETCNLAMPRDLFVRLDGFPLVSAVGPGARGFGEDVLLGAAAAQEGGARFVAEATVQHRWLAGSYRDHLRSRRRLVGFPLLLTHVPELRDHLWHRAFLSRRTAATDLAAVGVLVTATGRRSGLLAVLPWLLLAGQEAGSRPGRPLLWRLAQVAVADGVTLASLAEGSVRHRRPIL